MNAIYVIHVMPWNYLIVIITRNRNRSNGNNRKNWDSRNNSNNSGSNSNNSGLLVADHGWLCPAMAKKGLSFFQIRTGL